MKLIKQLNSNIKQTLIREDATGGASAAGDVAGFAMPLFSKLVQRNKPKKKVAVVQSRLAPKKKTELGLAEAAKSLREFEGDENMAGSQKAQDNFDSAEVIAKLKSLENKEKIDQRDTVAFGLEDEDGNTVRVTIRQEQAQDFERALQGMMASQEVDEPVPEIAEILFKMKDQFDIVDVQWPNIAEDEEEDFSLEGSEGSPEGDMGMPPEGDMGMPPEGGDTGQVTDLLTQVIDMMKADAEARKAEARAREAEAKTKEADAIVAQSMARVKQEEQYLDMDSYNKAKKEEEREAKRLAQLARWKHDMAGDSTDSDPEPINQPLVPNPNAAPEEEETSMRRPAPLRAQPARRAPTIRGRVAPHDIAQFIIGRVK